MKTHLFFFGKSESFSFQAYDEEGLIPDYDFFIKDFDKLESSVFTVDKVECRALALLEILQSCAVAIFWCGVAMGAGQ